MSTHKNTLPLLVSASRMFSDTRLDNVVLVACQHLLGSTYDMFEVLFSHGLRPENTFILGKCYSTNSDVVHTFQNRGVTISPYSMKYDSHLSFDEQFSLHVTQFIQQLVDDKRLHKDQKIILLDDGAELLLYVNDFLQEYGHIVGAEQTSSGYQKLLESKLRFPVVNIARSSAKLELESPMIAEVFVAKLRQRISFSDIKQRNVLVVGQGPIGKAVASQLSSECWVDTYDLSSHGNHFPGNYAEKLDSFDVIVGATGRSIIGPGDYSLLRPGVILTSISSSDREFSAVHLRRLIDRSTNCHDDVEADGIRLLNSGFPLNFDGGLHSVAPEKIQLTRSLLLAGVLTAAGAMPEKGLVNLGAEIELQLTDEFVKQKDAYENTK